MHLRCTLALGLVVPSLAAQSVTWVEGAQPNDLAIRTVDEAQPTAPPTTVRDHVELLPIEITSRTRQQALRDDVARLVERRGVRRVVLPGNGELFTFQRDLGQFWGVLWVRADGEPRVVLELPGTGAAGVDSPFADRLAVAPDGQHAVVTRADGRIHVVRLDGSDYPSTGRPDRLLNVAAGTEVDPLTVNVGQASAWLGTADERVWRVPLADLGVPADVTPPLPVGSRMKPHFAPSADGRAVVFLHGPQRLWSLYLVGDVGPAVLLPPPPAKYEEPGYLPEVVDGPKLLLNDDATSLLYVDGTIRDETFVLDVAGALPTTGWTADPNFVPYIGVIILPVAIGGVFVAGIGDPGRFDVHATAAGGSTTFNLTRTSAAQSAPFNEGNLLLHELTATANGTLLAAVEPSVGGLTTLFSFAQGTPSFVRGSVAGALQRGAPFGASPDFLVPSLVGDALLDGATGQPVLVAPPGVRLSTSVVDPLVRAVLADAGGGLRAIVVQLGGSALVGLPGTGVEDVLRTSTGAFVLDDPSGLVLIDPTGVRTIPAGGPVRVVLSGAGTSGI